MFDWLDIAALIRARRAEKKRDVWLQELIKDKEELQKKWTVPLLYTEQRNASRNINAALMSANVDDGDKTISDIFSDPDLTTESLYKILYEVERILAREDTATTAASGEQLFNGPWRQKLKEYKENHNEYDDDSYAKTVEEFEKQIKENVQILHEKRRRLYQLLFKHANEKYAKNPAEREKFFHQLTAWETPKVNDNVTLSDTESKELELAADAHRRMMHSLYYYQSAHEKNAASSNEWFLTAMGALTAATGVALLITSLVTGLFAGYLLLFAFVSLSGILLTLMGGKKAAHSSWLQQSSAEADARMRSEERIKDSEEYKNKSASYYMHLLTGRNFLISLVSISMIALIVIDFYVTKHTTTSLHAPGAELILNMIPSDTWHWGTYHISAPLPNVDLVSALEIFSGIELHTSILNYMALAGIGLVFKLIIDAIGASTKNAVIKRMCASISQVYNTAFYTYGLCSMLTLPFSMTFIPMIIGAIAAPFFLYCLYETVVNKKSEITIDLSQRTGNPAHKWAFASWKGLLVSAIVATVGITVGLSLFSNPLTFGVGVLLVAVVIGIARDQMAANASESRHKAVDEYLATNMKNVAEKKMPKPDLAAAANQNDKGANATQSPVRLSQPVSASGKPGLNHSNRLSG